MGTCRSHTDLAPRRSTRDCSECPIAHISCPRVIEDLDQEFAASWNRGQLNKDEQRALEKWYDLVNAMLLVLFIILQATFGRET